TAWTRWKRRATTTRFLNAVAVDWDCHDLTCPSEEEMLGAFNARRVELGLPEPNIVQFSGRGIWAFWLLEDENGAPGVRAWPLEMDNWLNLQAVLVQSFGSRADKHIKDPARLTRVPGSTNHKAGRIVRAYLWSLQRH